MGVIFIFARRQINVFYDILNYFIIVEKKDFTEKVW